MEAVPTRGRSGSQAGEVLINADLVTHHPATSLLLDARHQRLGRLCEICCNVQRPRETERRTAKLEFLNKQREDRDLQEIFDLLAEDNRLNVYTGKLEVRPPGAPTTRLEKRSAVVG